MERSKLVVQRIRELREKKFFQKDFAAHIDMKPSTYSNKENGDTEITLGELYRIADGLETTVAKLLGIEESSTQNSHNSIVLTQNNNGTIYFQPSQEMLDKLIRP